MKLSLTNLPKVCWDCGSDDVEWFCKPTTNSSVQDARLRLNEIKMLSYLSCHNCSCTVKVLNEDQTMALFNYLYFGE